MEQRRREVDPARDEGIDEVLAGLMALPDAGTPLTDEERSDIEAAWAAYRRGEFVLDPDTART